MNMAGSCTLDLKPRKRFQGGIVTFRSGLNLFIGANGSGKSSLLEAVYEEISKKKSQLRVVAFSSGQNENYSEIFDSFRRRAKRSPTVLNSKSGYLHNLVFTREWAPLLIVMAAYAHSSYKRDEIKGRVNRFLVKRGYIISDLGLKVRGSARLNSLKSQTKAGQSHLYRLMAKLLDVFDLKDAGTSWRQISVSLLDPGEHSLATQLDDGLYRSIAQVVDIFSVFEDHEEVNSGSARLNAIFNFFSAVELAALDNQNIELSRSSLLIKNANGDFSDKSLSDGEYQLLMTYAILDLFEFGQNIIILDESDSHVHQRMLPEMWDAITSSQVPVLTTTHNPTSLKYAVSGFVRGLRDGKIQDGVAVYKDIAEILDNSATTGRVIALGLRNHSSVLVLDSAKDWAIFIALAKRKLGKKFNPLLDSLVVYECSASQNERYGNENARVRFAKTVCETLASEELSSQERRSVQLKKIILLNDRDELAFGTNRYLKGKNYQVIKEDSRNDLFTSANNGEPRISVMHLFWHFREIENYLLTREVLSKAKKKTVIGKLKGRPQSAGDALKLKKPDTDEFFAALNCKDFVTRHIIEGKSGFSAAKLDEFVSKIKPSSISGYIAAMHDYLIRLLA